MHFGLRVVMIVVDRYTAGAYANVSCMHDLNYLPHPLILYGGPPPPLCLVLCACANLMHVGDSICLASVMQNSQGSYVIFEHL